VAFKSCDLPGLSLAFMFGCSCDLPGLSLAFYVQLFMHFIVRCVVCIASVVNLQFGLFVFRCAMLWYV
jgi:hypothetical protein